LKIRRYLTAPPETRSRFHHHHQSDRRIPANYLESSLAPSLPGRERMSVQAWPILVAAAVVLAVIAPIVARVSMSRGQPGGPRAAVEAPVAGTAGSSLAPR
jgi:hypothetical protein